LKLNLIKINQKLIENGFFERFPRVVTLIPSKVKSFYKERMLTENSFAFLKEVKETKALFREEGVSERIINDVPKLIKRVNRIRPALDRLAKC